MMRFTVFSTSYTLGVLFIASYPIENIQFKDRSFSLVNDYYAEKYGEFPVSANAGQIAPSITSLADGSFIVTYTSGPVGGRDIYAKHFSADGKAIGNEFRVNTDTISDQNNSNIAALNDGSYIVTWDSHGEVFGQHYLADDNVIGNEFRLNTTLLGNQGSPHVSYLDTGGFVAIWGSSYKSHFQSYFQRYSANGETIGSEVNSGYIYASSVSYLANGGFVVTYGHMFRGNYDVYEERFNINGTSVGGSRINTYITNTQENPNVITLLDGNFVVTWSSEGQDGSSLGIYGQRYDGNGHKIGNEFRVNSTTKFAQLNSSAAALADGGFIVTWQSDNTGNHWDIYGQRYAANGATVGGEFRINAINTGDVANHEVTGLNDGGFVITYSTSGQGHIGVYAQRFDAEGNRVLPSTNDLPANSTNNLPSGDVTITGDAVNGQTLTATNTLVG